MDIFAELEYRIGPRSSQRAGYPVSPQLWVNGQDQIFHEDVLNIDLDELFNLRGEFDKYDARLSEVFFRGPVIKEALDKARAQLDQAGGGNKLRVRLLIDSEAQELQHVRWECLRGADGKALFNGDTILFSRYLPSSHLRPVSAPVERKALIVIANPRHLEQAIDPENPGKGLQAVDVKNEKQRAEKGLAGAGFAVATLASGPAGMAPATLHNILNELEKGYDVLYLVCHGGLVPDGGAGKPVLWLEDSQDPVDGAKLIEGIRNLAQQPRLVVLASCQSAGDDGVSASASGTLGALGPQMAGAGVAAVVAMQGNIKMTTVDRFMPQFFEELAKDGQVDRAIGKARGRIVDCPDYWMPTLFMRLSDGRIWGKPAAAPVAGPAVVVPAQPQSRRGWLAGVGAAALAAAGGVWWMRRDPLLAPARKIFSDLSVRERVYPLDAVLDTKDAKLGELKAGDPAQWTAVVAAPNQTPFALLRGSFGYGRVLALGHEHMLTFEDAKGQNDFLQAGLAWLKGKNDSTVMVSAKPGDALLHFSTNTFKLETLRKELESWGYHVDTTQDLSDPAALKQAGIILIGNSADPFKPQEIDAITNFVKSGGGLLAAGLGWSWKQHTGGDLQDYPMNQLFAQFGASWVAD